MPLFWKKRGVKGKKVSKRTRVDVQGKSGSLMYCVCSKKAASSVTKDVSGESSELLGKIALRQLEVGLMLSVKWQAEAGKIFLLFLTAARPILPLG